jgi:hypothetical protein
VEKGEGLRVMGKREGLRVEKGEGLRVKKGKGKGWWEKEEG